MSAIPTGTPCVIIESEDDECRAVFVGREVVILSTEQTYAHPIASLITPRLSRLPCQAIRYNNPPHPRLANGAIYPTEWLMPLRDGESDRTFEREQELLQHEGHVVTGDA